MAVGAPVIIGPYTEHFSSIVQKALKRNAILQATSPLDFKQRVEALFNHPEKRQQLSKNGLDFWQKEQGATQKIVEQISNCLHWRDKEKSL
jgi:3-deoxy-D-manno-octulosonic-acid transferase